VACLSAATGGVLLSSTNSHPEPSPAPSSSWNAAGSTTGLSDIRPAEKIVSARERELLAVINSESSKPDDFMKASIELGLFYVKERRLDEANERFKKIEQKQYPAKKDKEIDPVSGAAEFNQTRSIASRLGQAVVLAYRNQKAGPKALDDAKASNDLIMNVVNDPYPSASAKQKDKINKPTFQIVAAFLLKHTDLYQAVSETLNRNVGAGAQFKPDQLALELLRAPPRLNKQ
jgi:serine/threonine-protein kinase